MNKTAIVHIITIKTEHAKYGHVFIETKLQIKILLANQDVVLEIKKEINSNM